MLVGVSVVIVITRGFKKLVRAVWSLGVRHLFEILKKIDKVNVTHLLLPWLQRSFPCTSLVSDFPRALTLHATQYVILKLVYLHALYCEVNVNQEKEGFFCILTSQVYLLKRNATQS